MNVIETLARILDGAPENAARNKPAPTPAATEWDGGPPPAANLAPMINATMPGSKSSPMDNVVVFRPPVNVLEERPFPTRASEEKFAAEMNPTEFETFAP